MPDPKRIDLKVVNEDYVAPAGATPHQQLEARLAAAIKEGKRRANAELSKRIEEVASAQIKGVKAAHLDELNRSGRIVSKAAHRDGLLQGVVLGMVAAIAVGLATWTVLREVVITNVNVARTPAAAVPVLQDNYTPPSYARDNPREPGDAPR